MLPCIFITLFLLIEPHLRFHYIRFVIYLFVFCGEKSNLIQKVINILIKTSLIIYCSALYI